MRVGWLALAAFLCVGAFSPAQARKLYPVDEGKRNPSFRVFRQKLIAALRQRDRQFVLGILHPEVQFNFDGGGGIQGFKSAWNLDKPGASWDSLRSELLQVLALGGSFSEGEFHAPYVYSKWPDSDRFDAFAQMAITGRRVAVRSRPSATAPILTRLTYDIVKVPQRSGNQNWLKIVTPNGRGGYVPAQQIRSAIDYRAGFRRIRGQWKLVFFVAGD